MPRVQTVRFRARDAQKVVSESGMTLAEVAARAGASVATVGRVLHGKPVGKLIGAAICRAIRSPMRSLIESPDAMTS
jgi:predicted transcriptional regulator